MKLIEVQAYGFKSFADKVNLKFNGEIVAIVGPNGSGKSNINDAIKWVLGESSSKALRGDSMEDVIFSGSETEKEMDKAEVILTFDNSDREVSIPHDKFTISRVLYRGKGSNEYYINGELARMKDIKEIAMQSGISKSSLAIISQGTISDVAEATPERRREFFEEAAGTNMYKVRKAEAQKKLEKTNEALVNITTLVEELDRQLKPLKRQAEKAQVFIDKNSQLKEVEVALLVHELNEANEIINNLQNEYGDVESVITNLNDNLQTVESQLDLVTQQRRELDKEISDFNLKINSLNEQISNLQVRSIQDKQQREWILSGKIQVSLSEKIESIKERLEELNAIIVSYKQFEIQANMKIQDLSEKNTEIHKQLFEVNKTLSSHYDNRSKLNARLEQFKDIRDNKLTLTKGTKTIVENSSLFKGYKGIVSDLLEVPKEYTLAVETVLASALQNIVVDVPETAVSAVEFLKNNKAGRATFIPLSSIKPRYIREEHLIVAQTQEGFVGVLSDLIQTKKEFDVLRQFLLGNILIANNIDEANKLSKLLEKKYMIVTFDGDIIRVGGIMTGGQSVQQSNTFELDKKIQELEDLIPQVTKKINELTKTRDDLQFQKEQLTTNNRELSVQLSAIKQKQHEAINEFDELKNQYETHTNKKITLEENIDFSQTIETYISERDTTLAILNSKSQKLKEINISIDALIDQKTELNANYRETMAIREKYLVQQTKANSVIEQANKRLSEQYSLLYENAKQLYYNPDIDYSSAKKIVQNLKVEIKELGNVNVDSIEELTQTQQRYDKISESQKELTEAKDIIEKAIDEMDKIIIDRITSTVELVNNEFKFVFNKMFGGGMAEIKYTDPNNLLETGLDIIAQPPGKSVKNLKLFSGGEKALIAISLLFSILKAKPLPLCILDEVEAALDEANVIRFAEFLHKLKQDTQFIVITHRQGTMERVDRLYGATMQNRGVTTFFSVELSKAKELIQDKKIGE
ncbi:AAA family ATPase [Mycoplasma zalophi]|uniref:Chromosome partition protein Smc n=1 Tax=Mycoplasma zalophi TaxID=191287 RepID=A0ABS6DPM1_9MOLU|nr:AAA family ATPase [Mycoplasma zalophi]MBU4692093.1 AAA family ATPase [Mycoplasma zalophi]